MSGETRFHICNFTDFDDVTITANGRSWRFEFSKRFGPSMIGKRGQAVAVPPMRSPFWNALQWWCQQGHRIENKQAIYDAPPMKRYVRLAGKHCAEVPDGADPATVKREWFERMKLPMPSEKIEVFEVSP